MSTIAKGNRQVIAGHICSNCGGVLVQTLDLYAEGSANAFFHERDMAIEARDKAFAQAMKDIVLCYEAPRMLGSFTNVPTDNNRTSCYYRFQGIEQPCPTCGHVEPWQLRKKSLWDPMDVPFIQREKIPNVPMASRPVLLESQEALNAWLANPTNPVQIEKNMASAAVTAKERADSADTREWVCFKCKTVNKERIQVCQGCGVTKQWSEAKAAKKK